MAASSRRDLFLQVSGNVDNLTAAMKAGRSVLNEFGTAANDTTAEVERAFAKLGGGSVAASARAMEASYTRAFANIRANAQAVLSAPTPQAAVQIINASGAEEAAAAAEAQAAGLRLVADAAASAAAATTGDAAAARVYATAAAAAALGAEEQATALRAQAGIMAEVAAEARLLSGAEAGLADTADEVVGGHNRMGASGLIAEHVVRSFSDSITAGQSPIRAFALELPRVAEAMQFFALETNATEGVLGKFAAFMSGGFGLAVVLGIAVLSPLIEKLFDADDAGKAAADGLEKAVSAADSFGNAESELGKIIDLTTGKLKTHNQVLIETVRLQAQQRLFDAQQAERTDAKTLASKANPGNGFLGLPGNGFLGFVGGGAYGGRGYNPQTALCRAVTKPATGAPALC